MNDPTTNHYFYMSNVEIAFTGEIRKLCISCPRLANAAAAKLLLTSISGRDVCLYCTPEYTPG